MATNMELRKRNRNNIYREVLRRKRTSKQQIALELGLSIPTVSQCLNDLCNEGLVEMNGVFDSTGGRKAQVVSCVSDVRVVAGVDITKDDLNIVLVDLTGEIIHSENASRPFDPVNSYYIFLQNLIREVTKPYPAESVLGVSFSVPAIVPDDFRKMLYVPLLREKKDMYHDLAPYMEFPYRMMNDANAGALAEMQADPSRRNFVYLMLGVTVGGSIIVDGKICRGVGSREGEFGHTTLFPGGKPCYCGKNGCVDAYISSRNLSSLTEDNLELFFEKLANKDEACEKKWEEYLLNLSIVMNNLQMAFNCEIVIGGNVGWHLQPYLERLQEMVEKRSGFQDEIRISAGRYNREACAYGAALQYINSFIDEV